MPLTGVFGNVFGDGDHAPEDNVEVGTSYNNGSLLGTLAVSGGGVYPSDVSVLEGILYGPNSNDFTGKWRPASDADVLDTATFGVNDDLTTGRWDIADVESVAAGHQYGVDGTSLEGTYDLGTIPDEENVRSGVTVGFTVGTIVIPPASEVREGYSYDSPQFAKTGVMDLPDEADVKLNVNYDEDTKTGTLDVESEANLPAVDDVLSTAPAYGPLLDKTPNWFAPPNNSVWTLTTYGIGGTSLTGTNRLPPQEKVLNDQFYGPDSVYQGLLSPDDPPDYPANQNVRAGVTFNNGNSTGDMVLPSSGDTRKDVVYDTPIAPQIGTLDVADEADLPPETRVINGVQYGTVDNRLFGNFRYPSESQVLLDVTYGANGVEFAGRLEVTGGGGVTPIYPSVQDVRSGTSFGNLGDAPYIGVYEPAGVGDVVESVSYGAYGVEFYGQFVCGGGGGDCPPNWIG